MRASVQLEGPIIKCPIEDVFAFTSNLENSPRWRRTVKTVKSSDGPVSVGTAFREEARIMGQKVRHQSEVTRLEPPKEFSYSNRFENGVTERTRITFETVDEGTRPNLVVEVDIGQVPQMLAPVFSLALKQRMDSLLKNLKDELEPPDRSTTGAGALAAVGAILLATAGMRYVLEILPEGRWRTTLALFASALVLAGAAGIIWTVARRLPREPTSASEPGEHDQTAASTNRRPSDSA